MSVVEFRDDQAEAEGALSEQMRGTSLGPGGATAATGGAGESWQLGSSACYIAVVDLTGSADFLDCVKSALLAALEALPASARLGVVTVGERVGVLDVGDEVGEAVRLSIPLVDGAAAVQLGEALELERLLVPVGNRREALAAALDALEPAVAPPGGGAPPQCAGAALEALANAAAAARGFLAARAMCFLAGAPTLGHGAVGIGGGEDGEDALAEAARWYADLASLSLSAGLAVDLFAVVERPLALDALAALPEGSGGALYHYPGGAEGAAVPQDVFRMLKRTAALGASLRLRTSLEFRVARAYGHLAADADVDNLYHAVCLDECSTFMFDFEFESGDGFDYDVLPTVQLAIRYSLLVPTGGGGREDDSGETSSNGAAARGAYRVERRLRVVTAQARVAKKVSTLHDSCRADVVAGLLAHKVIAASREEGAAEARLLLRDWLAILTANYNESRGLAAFGQPAARTAAGVDLSFRDCAALAPLPRLVYGLLRSDLLAGCAGAAAADARAAAEHLWRTLEPSLLALAIYPSMCSYYDEATPAFPSHSLSRAAITTAGAPIFLIDAFNELVCYLAPGGSGPGGEDPPRFPPAQGSVLRELIAARRAQRHVTPRLRFVRGGVDDAGPFTQLLIEEPQTSVVEGVGSSGGADGGFVAFLDAVAEEVCEYMADAR